ncbi:MAG: zinc-dependent metalloprotease family protein, partial [bacterium]
MKPSIKVLLIAMFFFCFFQEIRFSKEGIVTIQKSLLAQDNTNLIWSDVPEENFTIKGERKIIPLKYRAIKINFDDLKNTLQSAPFEFSDRAKNSPMYIELPAPDGTLSKFFITEYSMMEEGLASQYPGMKTFNIKGIDDPFSTGKIDITEAGFHAMILTPNGDYFIDPYSSDEKEIYISYYKSDFSSKEKFECYVNEEIINDGTGNNSVLTGQQLRTYRLACAATGEYTAFFGGTVPLGLAAIVTAVNRVNGVYERDASVRMTLVANNNLLVFTNSGTDPYTNNNGSTMLGQNQTTCTNIIGSANYDIGHVFSTGGGGVAGLGVVCNSSQKARGVT